MGVQGLSQFLKKTVPEAFIRFTTDADLFNYLISKDLIKVTGDVSIYMYAFGFGKKEDDLSFLDSFVEQYRKLKKGGLEPVYIFDGKTSTLKMPEIIKRHEAIKRTKELAEEVIENANQQLEMLENEKKRIKREVEATTATVQTIQSRSRSPSPSQRAFATSVTTTTPLSPTETTTIESATLEGTTSTLATDLSPEKKLQEILIQESKLNDTLFKAEKRRDFVIKPSYYEALEKLFVAKSIPFLKAPEEAEHLCAFMSKTGQCDVVMTNDLDAIACGATYLLRFVFSTRFPAEVIDCSMILSKLEITLPQFVDMCIFSGCDFCSSHIPGMGPAKAYKTIRKYKTIEDYLQKDPTGIKYASDEEFMKGFSYAEARNIFLQDPKFQ